MGASVAIGTVLARGMSLVIPDELSKSPLHVGIEGITSEDISEEISSNSFSVARQSSGYEASQSPRHIWFDLSQI